MIDQETLMVLHKWIESDERLLEIQRDPETNDWLVVDMTEIYTDTGNVSFCIGQGETVSVAMLEAYIATNAPFLKGYDA